MKKTLYTYIASFAMAGALAASLPLIANAQNQPQTRTQNIENNRDYRNSMMTKKAGDKTKTMSTSTAPVTEVRHGEDFMLPAWLNASTSPWKSYRVASSTMRQLLSTANKFASSTGPEGHENWKESRLDIFTWMQSHLISESQNSLNRLKDLRTKIAARIQTAEQNGYDMTGAKSLLAIADSKVSSADTAIKALVSYVPAIATSSSSSRIDPSSTVNLDKPRIVGNTAIQAVDGAKKALNDVVVAIAKSLGLKLADDKTTEGGQTASTTQQ